MSVENQDRVLAQPLELEGNSKEEVRRRSKTEYTREFLLSSVKLDDCKQVPIGFDPSLFRGNRPSKTAYTREFLLSCAELDICKQLPKGFDQSVFLEFKDGSKGILEPWKGPGVLFLPNSGNCMCRVFTALDSCGSSTWEPVGRPDYHSMRWSRESSYKGNYHSDFSKHDDLTRSLLEASQCKANDMGNRIQETEKTDYYQLSKSENPYRPPHTYQVGRTKCEGKSLSNETIARQKVDYGIQDETLLERHSLAEDKQHEIKETTSLAEDNSEGPVYFVKPPCHDFNFSEPSITRNNETTQFDSKKANMSPISEGLNEEQSRMILMEDIATSFEVSSGCSSTVIEKAAPRPLEAISEGEVGVFDKTSYPVTGDFGSVLKYPSDANREYFQMNQSQPDKPISEMEFNELLSNRGFYSGQRGSFNRIMRDEVSESYRFPFTIAYNLFSSVLNEHNPFRTNHRCITTTAVADQIELYDMEKNERTFDDMWSEMLEILQFERDMELRAAAESDQTASYKAQIPSREKDNLISIDYPTNSDRSKFVPLHDNDDSAYYDIENLPDEDSLITMDDLIAPEDRLISIDCPTSAELSKFVSLNSCGDAADYNVEIQLPDADSLITIDDLIAPDHLKFAASGGPTAGDTWTSNGRDEIARQPGALVIADPVKGSSSQGLEVPPSLNVTASTVYQESQFWHSSLHNLCTAFNPEKTMSYPFNTLEAQMRLHTTLLDRVPIHCYPTLRWYSCPNLVYQSSRKTASPSTKTACPKLKEFSDPLVQYSLLDQPTSFLQQCRLPNKDVVSSNWELEKTQLFPPSHLQTAYPEFTTANSAIFLDPPGVEGLNHQKRFNRFADGKPKPERALL